MIPDQYREEYFAKLTVFIRSRVGLYCILSVALYFFASLAGALLEPAEFKPIEILMGCVLIAGGLGVLYLNSRAKTYFAAKLNAFLFTALLLALIVRLGIDYAEAGMVTPSSMLLSSAVYVFVLFLVTMTIPWAPGEVVPIWIMHVAAFTMEFATVKYMQGAAGGYLDLRRYLTGVIFMFMAFFLCFVVRRRDMIRDAENFVLLKDVEAKNKQMNNELEWATRVHKTIIPHSTSTDKVDLAVSYLPVYYMGGDYVKFEFCGDDRLIFLMSDVTGHGVPAALLVNRIHAEFERMAKEGREPGALLAELNAFITEDFAGCDMFLSAFCGLLDFKKMKLLYSNYGHPTQYVYSARSASIHGLCSQATLLGVPMDDAAVHQAEMDVDRDDRVLLYTDGITETMDAAGEEYGAKRLEEFLRANHDLPVEDFNEKLLRDLDSYKDGKFKDDICLLTIGIKCHRHAFAFGR